MHASIHMYYTLLIRWTMSGSKIIMMPMQTVMLSVSFPILTRLIVTEPSLSLTVLVPISNCMVTGVPTSPVSRKQNNYLL